MTQTDYADFEPKSSSDRTVMHILYGMHSIAWASMGTLAVIALIVNYIKRADERDAVYLAHHNYMISTFWWAVLWLVLTSPLYLLLWVPGAVASLIVGLWYLYCCVKGWLRFNDKSGPV